MPDIRNIQSATQDLLIGVDPAWSNAPLSGPFQALTNDNTSNLWWYTEKVPGHDGYFWLHNAETADVIGINPKGGISSGSQLQSQLPVNEAHQWWTTVPVKDKPGYFWLESAVGGLAIDISSTGGLHSGSALQVLDRKSEDNQYWTWADVPHVSAAGLVGSNNYFLFGGYDKDNGFIPLNEVVVTVTITEDLIGTPQFSFQLNCWSPKPTKREQRNDGGNYDVWQQYGIQGAPGSNKISSFAENWPQNNPSLIDGLFEITTPDFWSLADTGTKMEAGTQITIILSQLNGSSGPISGSFVIAANGSKAASEPIKIIGQQLGPIQLPNGNVVANPGVVTSQNLAPIAAMQMNIVAYGTPNGQPSPTTTFTKGKGTIQYYSSTPMTVLNGPPTDVAAPGTDTGENSNCTYGTLPQGTSGLYLQTFGHS